jgi:hypothetical protein
VRSTDSLYARYATGEQELYLLAVDPFQLVNQAANPAYASMVATLRAHAQALCSPPPPNYSFTSTTPVGMSSDIPTI